MATLLLSAGAGLLLAVFYAASPLTTWALAATPLFFRVAGRGLPDDERRALYWLLGAAIVARVLLIVAMLIVGLPQLNDLSIGALSGDESYNMARALRSRDIVLGLARSHQDYFVAAEDYGYTLYVWLLGWIQVLFGPTPYSMRLVNMLLYLSGAVVLYRLARTAFGSVAALTGLAAVLFIPSLIVSSVSLLKESFYFLVTSVTITIAVRAGRAWRWRAVATAVVLIPPALWILNDLRRSAAVLTLVGIGLGLALRTVIGHRWRMAAVALAVVIAGGVFATNAELQDLALAQTRFIARTHAGHVFTVGHGYKLLDEGFYVTPTTGLDWTITMPQALRFFVRAAVGFVITPLPWQMASRSELLFLPEHVLWLVLVALVPVGLVAGWKRDSLVTAVLIGYVIPTALAVAVTNGNVGTLLRLRGLVSPYLVWLSALGLLTVAQALLAERRASRPLTPALASRASTS